MATVVPVPVTGGGVGVGDVSTVECVDTTSDFELDTRLVGDTTVLVEGDTTRVVDIAVLIVVMIVVEDNESLSAVNITLIITEREGVTLDWLICMVGGKLKVGVKSNWLIAAVCSVTIVCDVVVIATESSCVDESTDVVSVIVAAGEMESVLVDV